jgi:hypothetical protein
MNSKKAEQLVSQMFYGEILGTNPNTIRGLSAFNFSDSGTGNSLQADEFTMLHLTDTQGKTKSLEEIKSFHGKNNILVPSTYIEMIDSAEQMAVAIKLYQGQTPSLTSLTPSILGRSKIIKLKSSLWDKGTLKFLLSVSSRRSSRFNDECSTCEYREDVNENYLDFSGISFCISVQRIDVDLPDCFSKISLKSKPNVLPPPPDSNQDNESRHKDKKRKIENTDQCELFKLQQNEDYKKFTSKEAAATCPRFKSKGMCCKWHIQGHCFSTNNFCESHVPQNQLSDQEFRLSLKCRVGT